MKNTKRILALALAVLTVCTIIAAFSACGTKPEPEETTQEVTEAEKTTVIKEPEIPTEEKTTTEKETKAPETTKKQEQTTRIEEPVTEPTTKKQEPTTKKQEPTTKKQEPTTKKEEPTTKKEEPTTKKQEPTTKKQEPTTKKEEPATKKQEPTTKKEESKPAKYSCGSPNHHCTTKEEHEFICGLEAKGCSICGSHSCKSFYAIDEWGQQCYDITKCPKYSEKEDPSIYCEHCGRKSGLGDDGTCVRFTVDTQCPICGKQVKAKTCHSH